MACRSGQVPALCAWLANRAEEGEVLMPSGCCVHGLLTGEVAGVRKSAAAGVIGGAGADVHEAGDFQYAAGLAAAGLCAAGLRAVGLADNGVRITLCDVSSWTANSASRAVSPV